MLLAPDTGPQASSSSTPGRNDPTLHPNAFRREPAITEFDWPFTSPKSSPVFNPGGFGPPRGLTRASTCSGLGIIPLRVQDTRLKRLLRSAFARLPPHGLCRHATDSQTHFSIGTPSPHKKGSDGIVGTVSETALLLGVLFTFLTVSFAIGQTGIFSAYPTVHGFARGSTGPVLLGRRDRQTGAFRYGPSPSAARYSTRSPDTWFFATNRRPARRSRRTRSRNTARNPDGITRARFAIIRFRFATTHGISFPAGT